MCEGRIWSDLVTKNPESRAADPAALAHFVLVVGFFFRRLLRANLPVSPASLTCLFFTVPHFLFFPHIYNMKIEIKSWNQFWEQIQHKAAYEQWHL